MEYYELSASHSAQKLSTDLNRGLSEKEAQSRLVKHGKNVLYENKKKSVFARFIEQFDDFMIIVLIIAAAVSFVTSKLFGDGDITESVIILAIVTLNAMLGTIEQMRAEHSINALKKLSSPAATVIRNGQEIKINAELVVPGDIIRLRSGDVICADARLISCDNLSVDESMLTGESHEIIKDAYIIHPPFTPVSDLKNMVMASCSVTRGSGMAIVTNTGMSTQVGKIASMLNEANDETTPLQKRLAHTGKVLGVAALFICGIIFIIGTVQMIPPLEMFMTSVSLAVAAIPEGLPAIVTILLALGVVRMSSHNAIVKNLPSVETLGCATVICTDKTGTLTQNKMKVAQIKTTDLPMLLKLATLCTEDGQYINPTDSAILDKAKSHGIDIDAYRKSHRKTAQVPFDSLRKRMSVVCDGKFIVKGAPEYILPLCSKDYSGSPITNQARLKIQKDNNMMTENALRVIAVAYRAQSSLTDTSENDLVFMGLIGIYDPPRPEAKTAVNQAKSAGIRTIMITGDHANTAMAIAKATDIASDGELAVTGDIIDKSTDDELCALLKKHSVFARVTPEHKLRIINILKRSGEITAMTGDGINDAPALKAADIGCSMGINGTEVAKSASDIILTDDNYSTVVYAVREGRIIYDNIKKSVKFLLSSNIGEILTVFFGIVFGSGPPLSAIELLWVNLVTDSLPAIALGLDCGDEDIMKKAPVNAKKGLFSRGVWAHITIEGFMIGALTLLAYTFGLIICKNTTVAQTMSFFVLAISQLVHSFNMRSEGSVIRGGGMFKNKYLIFSFITGIISQLVIMYAAPVAQLFGICPLNGVCLLICIILSIMPLVIVELQKALNVLLFSKENL